MYYNFMQNGDNSNKNYQKPNKFSKLLHFYKDVVGSWIILLFSGWDYEVPGKDFNSIGSSRVYFEV